MNIISWTTLRLPVPNSVFYPIVIEASLSTTVRESFRVYILCVI